MALPTNVVQGNAAHVTHHNTIHALMPTGESVMVKTKSGIPVDGDFTSTPTNGTIAYNTSTNVFYVRVGGVWVAAGGAQTSVANIFTQAQTIAGGTTATDRLNLGADVSLYRNSANILRTDDSLQIKGPAPYADVRAHGAVGDGIADDTAAFNAAITASSIVFIPAGTYKVSLSLSSFQWRKFQGTGPEKSILKPPAGGTAITFAAGFNHGLIFEDLSIVGAATPAEKGIVSNGATTIRADFHRVQFRDLLFGFDTNGTTCETTGCVFTACKFDNAPVRFTGAGAHNTMVFEGLCRWAGTLQSTPCLEIHNSSGQDTNILIQGAVFESCNREAMKLQKLINVVIDDLYMEFNNQTGGASLPWIDVGDSVQGLVVSNGYFVGTGSSVFVGASSPSYGAHFSNNYLLNGSIDYANFTDHTRSGSGSHISHKIGGGSGSDITVAGGGGKIGFYGNTPVLRPPITGSRGGNAALANLLSQLASQGLITDNTT